MSTSGIAAALTITLATGMAARGTVVQQAPPTASAPPSQSAKDVKGWRGAEWGMSPEKVAAALGQELGKTKTHKDSISSLQIRGLTIGGWVADVTLVFRPSAPGTEAQLFQVLMQINLTQTKGPNDFRSLRDELKGTYGDPTSETDELDRPLGRVQEARWILPSTQITCKRTEVVPADRTSHYMVVYYHQRVKTF